MYQVLDEKRLGEGRLRYLDIILHRFQLMRTIGRSGICELCCEVVCMLQAFID